MNPSLGVFAQCSRVAYLDAKLTEKACKSQRADARTRTGDPFITSEEIDRARLQDSCEFQRVQARASSPCVKLGSYSKNCRTRSMRRQAGLAS
jgi:hypothetical protein